MGEEPDTLKQIEAELHLKQIDTKLRDARNWLGTARCYVTDYRDLIRRGLLSPSEALEDLYVLADPEGSLIYTRDAFRGDLEAVQHVAPLELSNSAAKIAEPTLLRVEKMLSDIEDTTHALKVLEAEMEKYGARQGRSEAIVTSENTRHFRRFAVRLDALRIRARNATVAKEVAKLQKKLGLMESSYNELLSALPKIEETRSTEFELR
jgi:hypothetical protein